MDAESFKLALSVSLAMVATGSAILAYRTRKQTRIDLFETQRDILLLTMSENDIRLKSLRFRIELLRSRLIDAMTAESIDRSPATQRYIEGLSELATIVQNLLQRDWTEEQVRQGEYSEKSLLDLRRRTLQEQVTAKTIQSDAHAVLLDEAQAELSRLERAPD